MKKFLKSYSKKRNFEKTAEPSGTEIREKIISVRKKLIFVVQEHHASHLHYDFRLELDGVLKSWAIPKGPSMNPEDKRLAVEVEDHPLAYASFHGTIPKGEYGAGEVIIWDKGFWKTEGDAHQGLKKGKLEFTLQGKKLKGDFVLVRMPNRGKGDHNWLLMKKKEVITSKSETPKKWPGFVLPQLAMLVDSPPSSKEYIHEIKFDGYRLQTHIVGNEIKIFSRNGHDWSEKFPSLINALSELKIENAILDGEAVVLDSSGKSHFNLLQDALSREDDSMIKIFLFDIFFLNGIDLRKLPLRERKNRLREIIPKKHPIIFYSEDVNQNAESFFELSCKHNLEGIVSKDATAPYSKGRSKLWCKAKCSKRQELVIGGYTTGKGSRGAELGALLLGVYERNKFRYVGKVGTGFNRQSLRELKEKVEKLEQIHSSFDVKSPAGKDIHWLKPKLVAEVSFSEWTSEKSLRHPVFIGLREDKKNKKVFIEDTQLTHPKKILYAKEKITKTDIAHYYSEVSKLIFPYVKDRPLSLVRCPNGAGKKCFYQKHPGKMDFGGNFQSFTVKEKSKMRTYLSLISKDGLNQLVQMNAFEIHAWNCHYNKIMNPDQIVMDFDPDLSVSFKQVVKVAFELKKMLDKLKLKSFVKVTGLKGIHIHIPISPIYSWEEIKAFSKALADELASRNPKIIATMSKEKRKGKIFVDYFRNLFGATAVVPYSLRVGKMSSVAIPVSWSELSKIKSADQFTLNKALLKIKKRKIDPWKDYLSLKQKINLFNK